MEVVDMPAPDALAKDENGNVCAAMFYYAAGDTDLEEIAIEHGFECRIVTMEGDLGEDHELCIDYINGSDEAVDKWTPTVPDGWSFGIKMDTEDGPVAIFVRRKPT